MHRFFGFAVTVVWLAAMAKLVERDVLPAWTAQAPPRLVATASRNVPSWGQSGIWDSQGRRVGTAWSNEYLSAGQSVFESDVAFESILMLPAIWIETSVTMAVDGTVDSFHLNVYGLRDPYRKPLTIRMHGEAHGRYIPCTLQMGTFHRAFKLDASASRLVGDGIRPFDMLRNLQVGQSWRMQMLDPLSAVLYQEARIHPVIARVERREVIEHRGVRVDCFVVTAGRARAWVAPDGRVLVQEADVPGLGRLTIRDEAYDDDKRTRDRKRIVGRSETD